MTNETTTSTNLAEPSLDALLNTHFAGKVVRKDLTKLIKEGANVPVYVLEYLLGMYCASDDEATIQNGMQSVKARVYVGASPEAVLFAFDHFKANLPRVSAFVKPDGAITCIRLNYRADLRPQAQS